MKAVFYTIFIFISVMNLWARDIPQLKNYATDETGTLTSGQLNELNILLGEFEKTDSVQMVFLMVNSIGETPVYKFVEELAAKNKIGYKDYNNGIVFLIIKESNVLSIVPGYKYERIFQPPLISSILRNIFEPELKSSGYFSAIKESLGAMILYNHGEYRKIRKVDYIKGSDQRSTRGIKQIIISFLILIPVFSRKARGLGTIFFRRVFSGKKRFIKDEFQYTGRFGERDLEYGKFGGLFAKGGPLRGSAGKYKGIMFSGKW